jgi:hypothetical protein
MQAPKDFLHHDLAGGMESSKVLSPESHVCVVPMGVEQGPNKASFMPVEANLVNSVDGGGCAMADLLMG